MASDTATASGSSQGSRALCHRRAFVGHGTGKLFGWLPGASRDATAGAFGTLGYPRTLAMEAAESQVLLKNSHGVLPLQEDATVDVARRNADHMRNQAG
jgi:hypothetical protein